MFLLVFEVASRARLVGLAVRPRAPSPVSAASLWGAKSSVQGDPAALSPAAAFFQSLLPAHRIVPSS